MMECPVQCGCNAHVASVFLSTSQAAKDLELTPTSISRESRQLEEMGLLHIRKVGVQRIMQSEDSPKTLFQKAGDKLLNPIKLEFVKSTYFKKEPSLMRELLFCTPYFFSFKPSRNASPTRSVTL